MKIAFIGAGSFEFTRDLVRDILTFPLLENATLALMDIDKERLDYVGQAVERIVREGKKPAQVETTTDRSRALDGADVVISTILAGGVDIWRYDIEIPKQYGIDINIGDTRGPAGIFRALRTIPVMLDICKDMERHCPDGLLLNYSNPMAMLCRAMQRESSIKLTGLCHSVQGTAAMLARWIGAPKSEISYLCAGINHQAWYLKFEWNGEDAYPLISRAIENPDIYNEEIVRNEMFRHLGYFVTESSGHNSEYNWWFRKRPDLIEKYCTNGTGWNPGIHAYILERYLSREQTWRQELKDWLADPAPLDLERGTEYAAYIMNAWAGGTPFKFNGNVPNDRLIDNLPNDACVEVPVYVDKDGMHPMRVGKLPLEVTPLTTLSSTIEEMTVEGCLAGDPTMVFRAIAHDPLTAAALSLSETREMVTKMFEQNRAHLPSFGRFKP